MKILSRYLSVQVFLAMLLVFIFMTSFFFLLRFMDEVSYELAGGYQVNEAFTYILLMTPETTYEYMPFIIMIGCLFALGNLSNNSELTILRAAGMSMVAIVRPVFVNVAILLGIVMLINENITPQLSHKADVLKATMASKGGSSKYGEWKKEKNSFVFLGSADGNTIDNVQSFSFDSNQLVQTQIFEQLEFNPKLNNWESPQNSETWQYKNETWHLYNADDNPNFEFTPDILQANQVREGLLSLRELLVLMSYSNEQEVDDSRFATVFYLKLFMPIITLALVWVCSIFVFGSNRKTAIGSRIFIGVIVGVSLKLLQNLLTPMVINFSLNPIFLGLVPLAIILMTGFYLDKKMQ